MCLPDWFSDGLICRLEAVPIKSFKWVVRRTPFVADTSFRRPEDGDGKLNRSLQDTGGAVLLVSQFTLYADARNGRRPSFSAAARPEQAERLYQAVADLLRGHGLTVETGRFQTHMQITLCNDGPVTLLLDSNKLF